MPEFIAKFEKHPDLNINLLRAHFFKPFSVALLISAVNLPEAAYSDNGDALIGGAVGAIIMNQIRNGETNRRTAPAVRVPNPSQTVQRSTVRQLQNDLNALGYNAGQADGFLGRRTRAAMVSLFNEASLAVPVDINVAARLVRRAAEQSDPDSAQSSAALGYLRGVAEGFEAGIAARSGSGFVIGQPVQANIPTASSPSAPPGPPSPPLVAMSGSNSAAVPTRKFAGPNEYPPEGFRGYGVIAFKSLATEFDLLRHNIICEAYIAALLPNSLQKSRNIDKFVTIWPVLTEQKSSKLNMTPISRRGEVCKDAISDYNTQLADNAIRAARLAGFKDTGRGPFFLGWLPSDGYGEKDALIIVMDMSLVETYSQAEALIAEWKLDIQTDPELLKNPYSPEMVRRKLRRWSDKYGHGFLTFIRGS